MVTECVWRPIIINGVDIGYEISSEGIRKKSKNHRKLIKFKDSIKLKLNNKISKTLNPNITIHPYIIYDYLFSDVLHKRWCKLNFDDVDGYMISMDDMRIINTNTLKEVHANYKEKYRLNTIYGGELLVPYELMKWQIATKITNSEYDEIILKLYQRIAEKMPFLKIDCCTYKVMDDIFLKITSNRYSFPFTVLKESNGNKEFYCIRTGKSWYNKEYYGKKKDGYTYVQTTLENLVDELIKLFRRLDRCEVYIKRRSFTNRSGCYNSPITEEECHKVCQLLINNKFCVSATIRSANEMSIPINTYYMNHILAKRRFVDISDQYFKINSMGKFYSVKSN